MTGGQVSLLPGTQGEGSMAGGEESREAGIRRIDPSLAARLRVIPASASELQAHNERLDVIRQKAGQCLWDGNPGVS